MAITRAQQAKQMLQNGGRIGLKPGGPPGGGATSMGSGRDYSAPDKSKGPAGGQTMTGGGGFSDKERQQRRDLRDEVQRFENEKREELVERFRNKRFRGSNLPGFIGMGLNLAGPLVQRGMTANRNFFLDKVLPSKNFKDIDFTTLTPSQQDELYSEYMSARLSGEIDAFGNPLNQGDDGPPPLFPLTGIMTQAPEEDEEPEYVNPLSKLSPRIAGSQFAADGGRIGFQEGGGIEQRLEKLGGDVSSAEKMLQGINQRLKTAESSLGSGGGLGSLQQPAVNAAPFMGRPALTEMPGYQGLPPSPIFVGELETAKPGGLAFNPMQTPPGMFPAGPPNFDTAFGGAFKGLDMSGFKPVMSPQQDMVNFSINGNEVQGMNSAFVGSLKNYLDSTGQGDAFSISGFTPLGGTSLNQTGQPQAVQQAFPGIPDSRPMGLAAADGTMSFMPNPLSPQQQMERANAEAGKLSPEERVRNAEMSLLTRDMKTPQQLAYIDRVVKSGGMDYLLDLDYFTNPELRSGIPAAGYADGGRITSLEDMDREGFVLGGIAKGLKKAVRGIKKLAKSPIGKAALAYAAFTYGGGGAGLKSKLFGSPALAGSGREFFMGMGGKSAATKGIFGKLGLTAGGGSMIPTALGGITLASAAAGLSADEDKNKFDIDSYYASGKLNPSQSTRMVGSDFDFYGGQTAADGGRIGYQKGGDAEPVAKKTMPLLDMGGKEMDLREEGGFVPIGRMEKADDVPARLSKNEFVFTADAVRNAGDGDVDKGAEVMYNMMKNLEAGGEVSEESQGLEGARKMFQTSQRLEEVL